jgi:hypothetical protein
VTGEDDSPRSGRSLIIYADREIRFATIRFGNKPWDTAVGVILARGR